MHDSATNDPLAHSSMSGHGVKVLPLNDIIDKEFA
jgi:hypothetical protein